MIDDNTFRLPRRPHRMQLSLAPLIDVTFILLIFFMLVTQFTRLAPVDASLGQISQSAPEDSEAGGGTAAPSRLVIHADGALELDGERLEGLAQLIEAARLKGEASHRAGPSGELPVLSIQPDGDVGLQLLIDALAALGKVPQFAVRIAIPRDADNGEEEQGEREQGETSAP